VQNQITGKWGTVPETAKAYRDSGNPWVIIADVNLGEGSSREHAALEPRFLGAVAVIAKSFARIHETNLKKQGILALTFANEKDYDRISPEDRISLVGLKNLKPKEPVSCKVTKKDGSEFTINLNHTFNENQLQWFIAGSALNLITQNQKSKAQKALAASSASRSKGKKKREKQINRRKEIEKMQTNRKKKLQKRCI